jgi:hypothetical protein
MAAHLYRRDFLRLAGLGSVLFASGLDYSAETSKDGKLGIRMSKESDNKAMVGRWFTGFWATTYNPNIVDELSSPDPLLKYSLHAPRRGREDIEAFII